MCNSLKKSWQNHRATVTVIRNGRKLQLPVKACQLSFQRADNVYTAASAQPARDKWGLQLRDLTPQIAALLHLTSDQGLIVIDVQPGSRAEATGIHLGDIIVAVKSAQQFQGKSSARDKQPRG